MAGTYIRDMAKAQMRRYAEKWAGLPVPRLQLRWAPKPVPASEKARAAAIRRERNACKSIGFEYIEDNAWDCFYELVLPSKNHTRDERYDVGFIIVPISWTRRTSQTPPCHNSPTDDVFRDSAHAFWDSSVLGWIPIYVIAPDGTATQKTEYHDAPAHWRIAK